MHIKHKKFELDSSMPDRLQTAAMVTVNKVLAIKPGEQVLIMANPYPDLVAIAQSLYNSCLDVEADPLLCYQPARKKTEFCNPGLIAAMESKPQVVMSISRDSLGQDPKGITVPYRKGNSKIDHIFKYLMTIRKSRTMWAPNVTAEIFSKTVPVNYNRMWRLSREIKQILDDSEYIHVTSPAGSDFVVMVKDRLATQDDGYYCEPGLGGNLPAGEVMVSPTLDSSFGKIVIDGSMTMGSETIVLKQPIILEIKSGLVQSIKGGEEAQILEKTLKNVLEKTREYVEQGIISARDKDEYYKNVYHIGEFGIGINPDAEIVGMMIEDEKAINTCHIAIGDNYDMDARAIIHFDGLIKNPVMTAVFPDGHKKRINILH